MPDHLHALVEGRSPDSDLRTLVRRMKQYTAYYFKQEFGHRLWQRYAYERVLRDDEQTAAVIAYILANPVRAQLVRSVCEYPYIGSI